jgi:hypothetical protein
MSTAMNDALAVEWTLRQREIGLLYFKVATYERLESMSLLELALWKVKMDGCKVAFDTDHERDEESSPTWWSRLDKLQLDGVYRQNCRINSGTDVVISNVLPFLDKVCREDYVVGDKSGYKMIYYKKSNPVVVRSSLLSMISQVELPSNDKFTTRRPILLQMRKAPTKSAVIKSHLEGPARRLQCGLCISEAQQHIINKRPQKKEVACDIVSLELTGPHAENLTVIDLPHTVIRNTTIPSENAVLVAS